MKHFDRYFNNKTAETVYNNITYKLTSSIKQNTVII